MPDLSRQPTTLSARPAAYGDGISRGHRGPHPALLAGAAGAATLAASALYVRYRARRAENRNPPIGRFIEVDGVRLHYVFHGSGQPVVLLHGNGALIQDFEVSGLVDLAAESYRVIVFDRPGYGYSDRPRDRVWTPEAQALLLRRAFARLGIKRPVVLGHSWGSLVAMALGLDHPDAVKSLVLLSGYFYPTARADVLLMSPPAIPVVGDILRHTIAPLYSRLILGPMLRKLFHPNEIPRKFRRFPKWMPLRPGQLRAAAAESALMIPSARRLSRRYHELAVPAAIMAGAGDLQVTTSRQSSRLHRDLPGSSLHVIPGVGHMIHHIVPEAVLAAIDEAAALGTGLDEGVGADVAALSGSDAPGVGSTSVKPRASAL